MVCGQALWGPSGQASKAGAAGPFKGQGIRPSPAGRPPELGGGLPRWPCSRDPSPPGGAPGRPARVPPFVRWRRGARSRSPPLPHAGAPTRTAGPCPYRRRPLRVPRRHLIRRAAAVGPVLRPLLARGRPSRRRFGSGGPRRAPCAALRSGAPGRRGAGPRGRRQPAQGARCTEPRGAGRMHEAAGRTDGRLLARQRELDRGGDSCLGPLGLL